MGCAVETVDDECHSLQSHEETTDRQCEIGQAGSEGDCNSCKTEHKSDDAVSSEMSNRCV
jgi:hypothetical protein